MSRRGDAPSPETLEARLAALISFYRWHEAGYDVPVAGKLLRGRPRPRPARGLLAHLDSREAPSPSSLVRVRTINARRPAAAAAAAADPGDPRRLRGLRPGDRRMAGNLRDRLLFALLAETGMRLGEALGMRINDFVMGRGGTPYVEIVPREDNPNGARVKMMRPRRVYVGDDLERLFADYLTHLACRADEFGIPITADELLFATSSGRRCWHRCGKGRFGTRSPALRRKAHRPAGWTPHWLRHSHATALLLAGTPEWVVSRRLGHAHVQTTLDLYGWVGEDEALRAAANWKTYTTGWQVPDGR